MTPLAFMRTHGGIAQEAVPESKQELMAHAICSLSLKEPESPSTPSAGPTTPEHRLNRYEIENSYLTEQNNQLMKELAFARYTIQALKTITAQKESALQATRQELDRAYFRIKMLGMTLVRQEQLQQSLMLGQRLAEQSGASQPDLPLVTKENDVPLLRRRSSTESLTPPESPRKSDTERCEFSEAAGMLNCSSLE